MNIAGANDTTYMLGVADEGASVRVVVTATNPDATVSAASAATTHRGSAAPPVYTLAPTSAAPPSAPRCWPRAIGDWTGDRQRLRLPVAALRRTAAIADIAGATGATYTLVAADVGARVRVIVTGANPDGSITATSARDRGRAGRAAGQQRRSGRSPATPPLGAR